MTWLASLRRIAIAGSPATSGTAAGLAAYQVTHDPEAALRFAVIAGALTLISLVTLALTHLAEHWIGHRSEHHFSSTIKHAVKVATSARSERRNAALAAAEKLGATSLTEGTLQAMLITRQEQGQKPTAAKDHIADIRSNGSRRLSQSARGTPKTFPRTPSGTGARSPANSK